MNKDWHEREEFWKVIAPLLFRETRKEAAAQEIDGVLSLLDPPEGAAVLDLCCGPGRHSLELARRGYRVTGVDRTSDYLELAREGASRENLAVEFVHQDMREFSRDEAFDAVINIFTSFGYFRDREEESRVLLNIHRSLRPGGSLIIDVIGREIVARIFRERDWTEADGVFLLEECKVSENWEWTDNRWIVIDDEGKHEFNMRVKLYTPDSLSSLLAATGFVNMSVYGSLTGAPYDHEAKRLVVAAKKPI